MTITHHPSDTTLAAFASGTLDEARALVVATHVSLCPHCRNAIAAFETVGGALLDAAPPAALSAGALARAMTRLAQPTENIGIPLTPQHRDEIALPAPLVPYPLGSWRRIGRGVQWRSVDVVSDDGVRVFMLKAAPGTKLPKHRHTGTEWTCVFAGAFRHEFGRYGAGDFDEADDTVEHDPIVENDGVCICLVALQGGIKLQGWAGRLLQPFIRI
jgi:putative transcriptional regulator